MTNSELFHSLLFKINQNQLGLGRQLTLWVEQPGSGLCVGNRQLEASIPTRDSSFETSH